MHFHICMNSLLTFISRCDSMIIKQQSVCMRFFFRLFSYHSKQYDYCLVMVQIIKSFLKVIKCGNLWAIECVETCVASSNPTRARMPKFLTGCIPCTRGAALAATSIIRNFCFKFVRDSCTLFVKCYYRLNELLCLRRRSITHCPCMLMPQRDISTEAREIREISGMMGNVHYRSPLPLPPHNPSTLSDTRAFLVVAISIFSVCLCVVCTSACRLSNGVSGSSTEWWWWCYTPFSIQRRRIASSIPHVQRPTSDERHRLRWSITIRYAPVDI